MRPKKAQDPDMDLKFHFQPHENCGFNSTIRQHEVNWEKLHRSINIIMASLVSDASQRIILL